MIIKCIICSMNQENEKDVRSAEYIVNGHGVCFDHISDVCPEKGIGDGIVISRPKS